MPKSLFAKRFTATTFRPPGLCIVRHGPREWEDGLHEGDTSEGDAQGRLYRSPDHSLGDVIGKVVEVKEGEGDEAHDCGDADAGTVNSVTL